MPEPAKRAGDVLQTWDLACPYCGATRELEGGHRVPPDACCYPQALRQLGWMVVWLRQPGNDPQEVARVREAANGIRRAIAGASRETIDDALRVLAERHGTRSDVYKKASDVARAMVAGPTARGGGA